MIERLIPRIKQPLGPHAVAKREPSFAVIAKTTATEANARLNSKEVSPPFDIRILGEIEKKTKKSPMATDDPIV
ncbi:hypothetical protein Geu3261_0166_002 [Komagataeibacter europaeus NBRC 3261]|uniref:Uncharacterized protein n=1 Tax=Komagataeibacter europaeus NBRC 3261 TaxID=1234669 RepID=A0A0D6Q3L8_KOMEU|nr:hypothetical protein Geu3261_0166_002 [Komagataeibacter europaeus NBRC 3261]